MVIAAHATHTHRHHHVHHHIYHYSISHFYLSFAFRPNSINSLLLLEIKFSQIFSILKFKTKKSRCGWQRLFAKYISSDLCNKMRCGSSPHHAHHHITNWSDHFYSCSCTKITADIFKIQMKIEFLWNY